MKQIKNYSRNNGISFILSLLVKWTGLQGDPGNSSSRSGKEEQITAGGKVPCAFSTEVGFLWTHMMIVYFKGRRLGVL